MPAPTRLRKPSYEAKKNVLFLPLYSLGNVDRPAGRDPEVVLLVNGPHAIEETLGIQVLVAQELECAPMELVRARFGNEAERSARGVARFGLEAAGFHVKLRESFHRRAIHRGRASISSVAADLIPGDRGAIERHAYGVVAAADPKGAGRVHFPRGRAARSKGLRELPFTWTGSESTSVLDTFVATLAFSVCITCACAVTSTLLLCRAYLEFDVHARLPAGAYRHPVGYIRLEALKIDPDLIIADRQVETV